MALGFAAMGLGTVLTQCFNTAGDTVFPAVVNLTTIWFVQLPLALVLRDIFDFDSTAVAWSIVAALLLRLVFYIPYFFSDRWMRARVI
jgi:Na+-driven multidrug efflux pump